MTQMLVEKEIHEKALNATAVKCIIDACSSRINVRANSSEAGDKNSSFAVTWAVVGQANHKKVMPAGNHRLEGKIHDILCKSVFRKTGEYAGRQASGGELDTELF